MGAVVQPAGSEPFISYSANSEDVMLNRVFASQPEGFFVDAGAAHPCDENDTYALYRRGWRGLNIEPNPAFFAQLQQERPEDSNLRAVLSDRAGELTWYNVLGTGLSTCIPEVAEKYRCLGREVSEEVVPAFTLAGLLDTQRATGGIDLLKVDVEGFEEKVLAGNNWQRYRPKLILVEATLPETPVRRETSIPQFLSDRGYRHLWFDGLNDFYGVNEIDFGAAFAAPPNVFDRSAPYTTLRVAQARAKAEEYARSLEEERDAKRAYVDSLEQARQLHLEVLEQERQQHRHAVEQERQLLKVASEKVGVTIACHREEMAGRLRLEERLQADVAALEQRGRERQAAYVVVADRLDRVVDLATRLLTGSLLGSAELIQFGVPADDAGARTPEQRRERNVSGFDGDDELADTAPPAATDEEVASRLVGARLRAIERELVEVKHDAADLRGENVMLHSAAEQMRKEVLELSRWREQALVMKARMTAELRAAHEQQSSAQVRMAAELRAAHEQQSSAQVRMAAELRAAHEQRSLAQLTSEEILSSRSWKLMSPYRYLGGMLRRRR